MADIDVVPKSRSYVWLWVLLAVVVVALVIWAFAGRTHAVSELRAPAQSLTAFARGLWPSAA